MLEAQRACFRKTMQIDLLSKSTIQLRQLARLRLPAGTLLDELSQHLLGVGQALGVLKRATRTTAEAAAEGTRVSQQPRLHLLDAKAHGNAAGAGAAERLDDLIPVPLVIDIPVAIPDGHDDGAGIPGDGVREGDNQLPRPAGELGASGRTATRASFVKLAPEPLDHPMLRPQQLTETLLRAGQAIVQDTQDEGDQGSDKDELRASVLVALLR